MEQLPLRDIHLPEAIGWWPPAVGWWLVLGLLASLILAFFLLRHWLRRRRKEPQRIARRELKKLQTEYQQHQNSQTLVEEISILLRRLYISSYPRAEVASLTGEAWLQFLDKQLEKSEQFTQGEGRCLIEAPYQPNWDINSEALLELCQALVNKKSSLQK